jgi:hypothetical protein
MPTSKIITQKLYEETLRDKPREKKSKRKRRKLERQNSRYPVLEQNDLNECSPSQECLIVLMYSNSNCYFYSFSWQRPPKIDKFKFKKKRNYSNYIYLHNLSTTEKVKKRLRKIFVI